MKLSLTGFWWVTASIGARVIASLCGLVLALMAAPEAFGLYGRVVLGILTAGVFVFLRLERAVIASETRDEAIAVTGAALRVALLALPTSFVVLWLVIPELGRVGQPALLATGVVMSLASKSLLLLTYAWLQREARGLMLALAMTAQALVQLASQIALLAMPIQPVAAMLIGDSLGAAAAFMLAVHCLRKTGLNLHMGVPWLTTLRKNRQLPMLNMPATFASQAATVLPLFAVAAHASAAETGAVAFAQRILEPAFYLGAALMTQYAVEQRIFINKTALRHQTARWLATLIGVGIVIALLLSAAVMVGQSLALPKSVIAALTYSGPIIAIAATVYVSGPIMDLMQLSGREMWVFTVNVFTFIMGCAVLWLGGSANAILWSFAALFASRAVVMLALWRFK